MGGGRAYDAEPMRLTWPDATLPDAVRDGLVGPGGPFELVTEPVLGVPMPVFAGRPRSLVAMLTTAAERFGERPYVVFPERTVTYGEMPVVAAAVARTLAERYGVGQGDRVAICAANCVEYAITFWAASRNASRILSDGSRASRVTGCTGIGCIVVGSTAGRASQVATTGQCGRTR